MRELVVATIGAIVLIAWGVAATNHGNDQWVQRPDGAFHQAHRISVFGAATVDANGGALNRDTGRAR